MPTSILCVASTCIGQRVGAAKYNNNECVLCHLQLRILPSIESCSNLLPLHVRFLARIWQSYKIPQLAGLHEQL